MSIRDTKMIINEKEHEILKLGLKIVIWGMAFICVFGLSACGVAEGTGNVMRKTAQSIAPSPLSKKPEPEETEAAKPESTKTEDISPAQIPLAYTDSDIWHSYEEDDDFIYEHDFMASRDGQGYHWWIYLEAAYIMRDYGKNVGYDFTLDHWTVERIYPLSDGYYNIVLSQNDHDVSMDLLCHPDEGKYVVLYAQYEDGDRIAGVNQIPYSSQLEWLEYDFHESWEAPSVENPYEEVCEASVSQALYIPLYHYEQDTGYEGEWQVRELFGRSPFFDYLVESEDRFVWFCVDGWYYTYVVLGK